MRNLRVTLASSFAHFSHRSQMDGEIHDSSSNRKSSGWRNPLFLPQGRCPRLQPPSKFPCFLSLLPPTAFSSGTLKKDWPWNCNYFILLSNFGGLIFIQTLYGSPPSCNWSSFNAHLIPLFLLVHNISYPDVFHSLTYLSQGVCICCSFWQ